MTCELAISVAIQWQMAEKWFPMRLRILRANIYRAKLGRGAFWIVEHVKSDVWNHSTTA